MRRSAEACNLDLGQLECGIEYESRFSRSVDEAEILALENLKNDSHYYDSLPELEGWYVTKTPRQVFEAAMRVARGTVRTEGVRTGDRVRYLESRGEVIEAAQDEVSVLLDDGRTIFTHPSHVEVI